MDLVSSDEQLLELARYGDSAAFASLWKRHKQSALNVARCFPRFSPDDLVSEAYLRIFVAISQGKGPRGPFRQYLFRTIRNAAIDWSRSLREDSSDDWEWYTRDLSAEDEAILDFDKSTAARAFSSLPKQWQEVLWYCEVDNLSNVKVAQILGITPNLVAGLAFRAREGLKQAWIQEHLNSQIAIPGECAWTLKRMGRYTRGRLTSREHLKAAQHLCECFDCALIDKQSKRLDRKLAAFLLPITIGADASRRYGRNTSLLSAASRTVALQAGVVGMTTGSASAAVLLAASVAFVGGSALVHELTFGEEMDRHDYYDCEISPAADVSPTERDEASNDRPSARPDRPVHHVIGSQYVSEAMEKHALSEFENAKSEEKKLESVDLDAGVVVPTDVVTPPIVLVPPTVPVPPIQPPVVPPAVIPPPVVPPPSVFVTAPSISQPWGSGPVYVGGQLTAADLPVTITLAPADMSPVRVLSTVSSASGSWSVLLPSQYDDAGKFAVSVSAGGEDYPDLFEYTYAGKPVLGFNGSSTLLPDTPVSISIQGVGGATVNLISLSEGLIGEIILAADGTGVINFRTPADPAWVSDGYFAHQIVGGIIGATSDTLG
ncbi:RNA polymerase sigma factor [Lysinibacter cavernae]|uniref:RNA polymerase sigma factor n=1 Tax=Lysinibacter cavernae TaxID=1640652 RepID=UPI00361B70DC